MYHRMTSMQKNFPVFASQDDDAKNCGLSIKIEPTDGYLNQANDKRFESGLEPSQSLYNGEKIHTSKKRKRKVLSIQQKVEVLQKLDLGVSIAKLREQYGIGQTTIYDLRTQKEQILKFYTESDSVLGMAKRKTLRGPQNAALEKLLYEWFCQHCSEGVHVTGSMLIERAKQLHNELKVSIDCEYSSGWLQKFRNRHGIRHLKYPSTNLPVSRPALTPLVDSADFIHLNPCPNDFVEAENTGCSLKVTQVCSGKETELILQKLAQDSQILERTSVNPPMERCSSVKEESKESLHSSLISQESPKNFLAQKNLLSTVDTQECSTETPWIYNVNKSTQTEQELPDCQHPNYSTTAVYEGGEKIKNSETMTVEEAFLALDSLIQFLEKQFFVIPQEIQLLHRLQDGIASKIKKEKSC